MDSRDSSPPIAWTSTSNSDKAPVAKKNPSSTRARDGRVRAVIACERCKGRRMKCDGGMVCSPCVRAKVECEYQGSNRRVWVTQNTFLALEREKAALQTKCNELEQRLQELELASGLVDKSKALSDSMSVETPVASTSRLPPNTLVDTMMHAEAESHAVKLGPKPTRGEEVVDGVPSATALMTDPQGRARYLGECSGSSFHDQLWQALYRALPMNFNLPAMPLRMHSYHTSDSRPIMVTTSDPLILPPRSLADQYITTFFATCSEPFFWMPFESVEASVDRLYRRESGSDDRWTLCNFYLILALGAQHSSEPSQPSSTSTSLLGSDSSMPGMEYFTKAKLLLYNFCEDSSLLCIKALALTSLYLMSAHRRDAAYSYIGLAVRSCLALGLHRDLKHPTEHEHELVLEERRRLFWSVFCLDRIICLALGRTSQISEDEIRVPPPIDTPGLVSAQGLQRMVVLCRIAGSILHDLYVPTGGTDTFSISAALELVDQLERCSTENKIDSMSESIGPRAGLMPELLKSLLINIASRPVFLHIIGGTAVSFAKDVPADQHTRLVQNLQQRCTEAAQATLRDLEIVVATGQIIPWSFFDLHFTYNAAVTLTLAPAVDLSLPSSPATAVTRTILDMMTDRGNESAASCSSILSALELVSVQLRREKESQLAPSNEADKLAIQQELIDAFQATVASLEREQSWLSTLGPTSHGTNLNGDPLMNDQSVPKHQSNQLAANGNGHHGYPFMQYFSNDHLQLQLPGAGAGPSLLDGHVGNGLPTNSTGGVDSFFTFI